MTFVTSRGIGISRQRGFWLRYFLSAAILLFLLAGTTGLYGQIDIPGAERLSHVSGVVVDPVGHPVANLKVSLVRDDKSVYETKTDASGRFQFEHISAGPFTFRIARSKFAPAAQQIVVTDEVVTYLERKKLYVILGPAQCQDACSAVLTNKREFDKALRRNRHEH
jgi:hypothetical protein